MYNIGRDIVIRRVEDDMLEIKMGDKTVKVYTEDLAALVREELPRDRAAELFSEIQERELASGKARVAVRAKKRIEKDEEVIFTININKYLNYGKTPSVRTTPSGFIF